MVLINTKLFKSFLIQCYLNFGAELIIPTSFTNLAPNLIMWIRERKRKNEEKRKEIATLVWQTLKILIAIAKSWKVGKNLPSSSSVFRSTLYAVYMVAQKCGPVNSILGESVISSVREPFFRGIYEHLFECQKCRLPGPYFFPTFCFKNRPSRAK